MTSTKQNFFYNSLLSLAQVVFPLITFPYVARVLNPEGIGEVSFVESIVRYGILFSALGIPIYGVREVAKVKKDAVKLKKLFNELFLLHLLMSLVPIIICSIAIAYFSKFSFSNSYVVLGCLMIISNVFLFEWFLQGMGDFKFITQRSIIVRLVIIFLTFLLIKRNTDTIAYFGLVVMTSVMNGLWNFMYILKYIGLNFDFSKLDFKRHLKPMLYIFGSLAFISVYTLLDTLMLGILADEKAVGLYSTAVKFSRVPIVFIAALGGVLISKLSELYEEKKMGEFTALINKSVRFVLLFSIPTFFFLLGLSKQIILVFAGADYKDAYILVQILGILSLLIGLSNIFGLQILTAMSKDRLFTYSVLLGTIISLSLNFILIPIYKEVGAAVTNVITEIAVTLSTFIFARRYVDISFQLSGTLKLILFSLPLTFLPAFVLRFTDSNLVVIVISSTLAVIYYFMLQFFVLKEPILIELKDKINERL